MAGDDSKREAGAEGRAIVGKNGTSEFAAAFTSNPVLEASVLNRPWVGTDAIAAFFAATVGGMYNSLRFTTETVNGRKTYLEWEATRLARMSVERPSSRAMRPASSKASTSTIGHFKSCSNFQKNSRSA